MDAVMVAVGWGGTMKGELTSKAMVRYRIIAERLGCLDEEGWSECAAVPNQPSNGDSAAMANVDRQDQQAGGDELVDDAVVADAHVVDIFGAAGGQGCW